MVFTLAGSGHAKHADGFGEFAHFSFPTGIAVDHMGTLYVAEFGGHRVRVVEPNGLVRTLVGSGKAGDRNGVGLDCELNHPSGIAVGPGYLLVADQFNHKIKRITIVHRAPIVIPEAEPDTDVESLNSLEDWYNVYEAEQASFSSDE